MYNESVLKIFSNPANAGRITKPEGIADLYNEDKTAHVEFSLRITDGLINECKFRAQANPMIIAICSTITEMVVNKPTNMLFIDKMAIVNKLGDASVDDVQFCIECVTEALEDYKIKLQKAKK